MTFEDLLKASANGLPRVQRTEGPVNHAKTAYGKVVVIKDNGHFKGCAIMFDGMKWDTWFNSETGTDKRSHYMSELALITEPESK